MKSISLGVKKVRIMIENDGNRIFEFVPSDSAIRSKFAEFCKTIEEISLKLKNLDTSKLSDEIKENKLMSEKARYEAEVEKEIELDIRNQFDNIFGAGSTQLVFGNVGLLTENSTGEPIIITAINAIMPYFEQESKKRTEKYTKGLK